jgi:hypothetical protein
LGTAVTDTHTIELSEPHWMYLPIIFADNNETVLWVEKRP